MLQFCFECICFKLSFIVTFRSHCFCILIVDLSSRLLLSLSLNFALCCALLIIRSTAPKSTQESELENLNIKKLVQLDAPQSVLSSRTGTVCVCAHAHQLNRQTSRSMGRDSRLLLTNGIPSSDTDAVTWWGRSPAGDVIALVGFSSLYSSTATVNNKTSKKASKGQNISFTHTHTHTHCTENEQRRRQFQQVLITFFEPLTKPKKVHCFAFLQMLKTCFAKVIKSTICICFSQFITPWRYQTHRCLWQRRFVIHHSFSYVLGSRQKPSKLDNKHDLKKRKSLT